MSRTALAASPGAEGTQVAAAVQGPAGKAAAWGAGQQLQQLKQPLAPRGLCLPWSLWRGAAGQGWAPTGVPEAELPGWGVSQSCSCTRSPATAPGALGSLRRSDEEPRFVMSPSQPCHPPSAGAPVSPPIQRQVATRGGKDVPEGTAEGVQDTCGGSSSRAGPA